MKLVNHAYKRAIESICEQAIERGEFDFAFYRDYDGEHVVEIKSLCFMGDEIFTISDKSLRVLWEELREFCVLEDLI